MNPFKSEEHNALVKHLFNIKEGETYNPVPHMAYADYLEENGFPLYSEVVKSHIKNAQENSDPLVFPTSKTPILTPHSHSIYAADTEVSPSGHNIIDITHYPKHLGGKNATTINYDLNGSLHEDHEVGVSYSGQLPLTTIIKHGIAQQQNHPTQDVDNVLNQLNNQVPVLYDYVKKEPHKCHKEYEFLLKFTAGKFN